MRVIRQTDKPMSGPCKIEIKLGADVVKSQRWLTDLEPRALTGINLAMTMVQVLHVLTTLRPHQGRRNEALCAGV